MPTGPAPALRTGTVRARPAPGLPDMHPDVERVLAGDTTRWGTSSQAAAEHRAMIALAGGLPPGWQAIAERAKRKGEEGSQ